MTEHVFGLTVNEVMAYAAIANVVLVLLLAPSLRIMLGTESDKRTRAASRWPLPIDKPTLRSRLSTFY
jgi:hypothetical protein